MGSVPGVKPGTASYRRGYRGIWVQTRLPELVIYTRTIYLVDPIPRLSLKPSQYSPSFYLVLAHSHHARLFLHSCCQRSAQDRLKHLDLLFIVHSFYCCEAGSLTPRSCQYQPFHYCQ